jgi:citrate lyase subunit gamma (acyl carrier protein)
MLQEAQLTDVKLLVNDRGALECTLRARLTTALRRSCGEA